MHFNVNINGNSHESLMLVARRLGAALDALEGALAEVGKEVLHGRNYQRNMEPEHDRGLDLQRHDTAVACFVTIRNYHDAMAERLFEQEPR